MRHAHGHASPPPTRLHLHLHRQEKAHGLDGSLRQISSRSAARATASPSQTPRAGEPTVAVRAAAGSASGGQYDFLLYSGCVALLALMSLHRQRQAAEAHGIAVEVADAAEDPPPEAVQSSTRRTATDAAGKKVRRPERQLRPKYGPLASAEHGV